MREALHFLSGRFFDLLINLNLSRIATLLSALIPAGHRSGPQLAPDRQSLTTAPWTVFIMNLMPQRKLIRFNLVDLLACYAVISTRKTDRLIYQVGRRVRQQARELVGSSENRPLVGFQLGSRHQSRQWPPENYAALAKELIERHRARIVLLGTAGEKPLGAAVLNRLQAGPARVLDSVTDLMGRTTLDELAGVLSELDLLVTTDTGTMHLASAVQTPILALFMGPALCHETGPYGKGHMILQVEKNCSPCREGDTCAHEYDCRYLITPEAALTAIGTMLFPPTAHRPGGTGLGPGVRLFQPHFDRFGIVYRPLDRPPLGKTDLLALAYREAGRAFLRPGYAPCYSELAEELECYSPPTEPEPVMLSPILNGWLSLWTGTEGGQALFSRMARDAGSEPGLEPARRVVAKLLDRGDFIRARSLIQNMKQFFDRVVSPDQRPRNPLVKDETSSPDRMNSLVRTHQEYV